MGNGPKDDKVALKKIDNEAAVVITKADKDKARHINPTGFG